MTWRVYVNGQPKGEVYKNPRAKRWEWFKATRGKEIYPARTTLNDVVASIANLCRVDPLSVVLEKTKSKEPPFMV
jgi:hypothetical protein